MIDTRRLAFANVIVWINRFLKLRSTASNRSWQEPMLSKAKVCCIDCRPSFEAYRSRSRNRERPSFEKTGRHGCRLLAWSLASVRLQVVQVQDPHRGLMVTTSLGVIVFTTVFFGAVMPFFTRGLKPERTAPPPSMFQYREFSCHATSGSLYRTFSLAHPACSSTRVLSHATRGG